MENLVTCSPIDPLAFVLFFLPLLTYFLSFLLTFRESGKSRRFSFLAERVCEMCAYVA